MGLDEFTREEPVEFAQGSVFGYRSWSFIDNILTGAIGYAWPVDRHMVATCGMTDDETLFYPYNLRRSHKAPDFEHTCGLYAFWSHGFTYRMGVDGVIEAYGKIVIGDRGFRAEKAKIVALRVNPITWVEYRKLKRLYNVPVYFSRRKMLKRHPITTGYMSAEAAEQSKKMVSLLRVSGVLVYFLIATALSTAFFSSNASVALVLIQIFTLALMFWVMVKRARLM